MKLSFHIEYKTVWGESLRVNIGSDVPSVFLSTDDGVHWHGSADVQLPANGQSLLYRYCVWQEGQCTRREHGTIPHAVTPAMAQGQSELVLRDCWWEPMRVAGVAIPVFSLRSEGSFGVGDFGDLKSLIQWASDTHMKAVQILPVNDTTSSFTWQDSYPYNAISIYAFHPQYIDLRQLPALADAKKAAQYEAERKRLNALPTFDYEPVNLAKRAYLHDLYEQEFAKVSLTDGYRTFIEANLSWLHPYAAFSVLRDQYRTADYNTWPEHSTFGPEVIDAIFAEGSATRPEADFYIYMQYLLHVQLLEASTLARNLGVILKGDIPIGVNRTSVETWTEPFYFNMNGSTGAPPDAFSVDGQNWGFPTYNWDRMQQDGLQWWVKRLRKMGEYFSAYRIDHLLGFFRIWEIPTHSVHGLLGQFSPAMPLTVAEIEAAGLPFQKEFMTTPFINENLLWQVFGSLGTDTVGWVKEVFLNRSHDDIWTLKPEFATQRQVQAFFADKTHPDQLVIRDGLYRLISNVLFLEDHRRPGLYHPRISAQSDYLYTRLQEWEKAAFDRLYEDFYYVRHSRFWYKEAMQKLPCMQDATQMIVCGEDLGMVPECVPWVMEELKILSLEVQRMPKAFGETFGHVWHYPVNSVCTTGSHDTETLRQWWELDPALTQQYWKDELHEPGKAPATATPEICQRIVYDHLLCPSLFCILPLQDWLAIDGRLRNPDTNGERINIPANPRHRWCWRMHLTIEQLASATEFNEQLTNMIVTTKR